MYQALILDQEDDQLHADVRSWDKLEEGDVTLEVAYSGLNYKDALAVTGEGKIIRGDYPFIPGIDLVARVKQAQNDTFAENDWVIGTGWGFGENHWGGYTEKLRTRSKWLVPLPDGLSPEDAMIIGTAGFTAMLSVMALEEHHITPDSGDVLVTGASGGAGSIAVALLARLGYDVVASTGSEESHEYLKTLGAERIVSRGLFDQGPERPMESGKWAGAVDAVGGKTLATILAQAKRHGAVAAFGNAGGAFFESSVFPFILRGVNLLGIDSNTCPNDRRIEAWGRLAELLDQDVLSQIKSRTISLTEIPEGSREVLSGSVQGRILVDIRG